MFFSLNNDFILVLKYLIVNSNFSFYNFLSNIIHKFYCMRREYDITSRNILLRFVVAKFLKLSYIFGINISDIFYGQRIYKEVYQETAYKNILFFSFLYNTYQNCLIVWQQKTIILLSNLYAYIDLLLIKTYHMLLKFHQ